MAENGFRESQNEYFKSHYLNKCQILSILKSVKIEVYPLSFLYFNSFDNNHSNHRGVRWMENKKEKKTTLF